ncbi:hypothetical protein J3B02_001506 [Coemansia erecta]|uniref:Uncharacterized protein n=1 Tax=Coemansia asiatica TaxID=1052880 RepID=A0A9W8CKS4_9FUNG|nr:hypothetical protein LPJ64_002658 [Coemansia asiatica]KAJ2856609.1 hypothetical protein J3B02_001506 [Coemansia erecta]KAJ2884350.1 hypothetical protein FB639_001975 [Coemansia asiatica]
MTIAAAYSAANPQPSVYIFGDSISDTGRLKKITLGIVPPEPYWNGRFSSGPVWTEYFSLLQGTQLRNYAVGAAVTATSKLKLFGFLPLTIPSTKDQINQYIIDNPNTPPGFFDIAVLEIGGNDIMTVLPDVVENKVNIEEFAESLSNAVISQCQLLKTAGFKTIFVTNAPPMQYVPLMAMENRASIAGAISKSYNAKLASKLPSWGSQRNIRVGLLDFDTFVTNALSSDVSRTLGIMDTSSSCIGGNSLNLFTSRNHAEALIRFLVDIKGTLLCSNPSTNFFWDPIHPGERVHRLFGFYASEFANSLRASNYSSLFLPTQANLKALISAHQLGQMAPKPARI